MKNAHQRPALAGKKTYILSSVHFAYSLKNQNSEKKVFKYNFSLYNKNIRINGGDEWWRLNFQRTL
ncbi:hypothetical protein [Mesobacillus subterraneus]|uniref:hypothetical protein n=1 Tax=Mesobacillus subterraneus TaxID=285983 RepID=UPI001CFED55F|nr:hypothetical protein [Mesobacillus subterraneus]